MKINKILKYIGENNSMYRNYKGIYEIDDNNLRQGIWELYYSNGKLKRKGNYKNGIYDGYWEEYFSNGQLQSKGNYINGKLEGYWEYFYSNGNMLYKGNYVNGVHYEN